MKKYIFGFPIVLIIVLMFSACQPAHDWMVQYPKGFKPKVLSKLVSTYDRDSIFVDGRTILEIPAIYANEAGQVWSVEGGGVIRYAKDGIHFKQIAVPVDVQLTVASGIGDEVWVGGTHGVLLHCNENTCVREQLPGKPAIIWGLSIADNKDGWAWSNKNYNVVYRRREGKWQLLDSLSKYQIYDMWCSRDGLECWAIGDGCKLLHFKNEVWDVIQLADKRWEPSLAMSQDGKTGWAYGAVTYHYSDGKWNQQFISAKGVQLMRCSPDGSECWAAGDSGDIFHYSNGKWEALPVVTNLWAPLKIWFTKDECWIACLNGVYHTTDKRYFSKVELGEKCNEGTAIATNSSNIWIGGWDYNVFRLERKARDYYPALSAFMYSIASNNSVEMDFKFNSRLADMPRNLPDSLWLNAYSATDSVHPRVVHFAFSCIKKDSVSCWFRASVPIDSIVTGTTGTDRTRARLSLSYHTNGGNEYISYDLKGREGSTLHLSK